MHQCMNKSTEFKSSKVESRPSDTNLEAKDSLATWMAFGISFVAGVAFGGHNYVLGGGLAVMAAAAWYAHIIFGRRLDLKHTELYVRMRRCQEQLEGEARAE